MQKNNKRIATKIDLTICISVACALLLAFAALCEFTSIQPMYIGVAFILGYFLVIAIWAAIRKATDSALAKRVLIDTFSDDIIEVIARLKMPVFMCNDDGEILWCNKMFAKVSRLGEVISGTKVEDVCSMVSDDLKMNGEKLVTIGDRLYRYDGIRAEANEENFWFAIFTDCTELEEYREKYFNARTRVMYIVIDNIDELLQYVQDKFRSAEVEVEERLKKWARDMGAVLKEYEDNKYLLVTDDEQLSKCIASRFDILDSIRSIRVGDGIPLTISIGASSMEGNLLDREMEAQAALDLALQRGGDQAVLKTVDGIEFFGGKTKSIQKRTNVRARVVANELCSLLGRAENVLIMGHSFGDFDSFGASVGVARLAMAMGHKPNIIINKRDVNIKHCFEKLSELPDYDNVFVDKVTGLDLIRPDTLLVIVDVNNPMLFEAPDIAHNVKTMVVIDHHRKTGEYAREPRVTYIEPSASSASELVSEIIEQSMISKNLEKEEAELLLAGIILDTKQFTRNTGTRTFGAAQFLRSEGANPLEANDMFKMGVDDLVHEAYFHTNLIIYQERIAISHYDAGLDSSFRLSAAKAADSMLKVKGIDASFILVKIGDSINISARSNGDINVQIILEALNGGGHFDAAGAQVKNETMSAVVLKLKKEIDKYIDNNNI